MIVLKVYGFDDMSSAIPIVLEDDKCYCDHNLNGFDTLAFEIQRKNDNHTSIVEEAKVVVFGNRFVIKKIDEHSDFTTVSCEIDLDDWKAKLIKNYRAVNELITNVMQNAIPDGWTITYGTGVDTTSRGTVEKQEGKAFIAVTSLELLDYISNAFSVVFNFDVLNKIITVINTDAFTSSGEFFMEDLNMTELGYNGDSTNFITRVYAYGKDGLTFADINDNKEYVENASYSNKVINYVLIDERYTIKQNLLQYAQKVLNEKCMPQKSYTCSIKNFDGDIWLYKIITIVDQRRKTRVEHQCVKYREYNDHSLDSITLSSQVPSIEKIVSDNAKTTNDLIEAQRTTIYDLIQQEVDAATAKITGSQGGYFRWFYDADGNPIELVNLGDTKDVNTAQKVWRWNQGGLGHSNNGYNGTYDLALTNDGKINASMITTGILNAGVIRAGIIQDLQNSNFWNLETGAFSLSANATVGGSTVSSIAQTEAEAAVNAQTQLSIFNKLTNNGATQGIYLYDGKLYLNASYIQTGIFRAKNGDTETFYVNAATGTVKIIANTFQMSNGDTIQSIAEGKATAAVNGQTQQSIFNKLTNNGQTQGIYLQDGKLYINASYIATGILKDADSNTKFNLSTGELTMKKGSININGGVFKVATSGALTATRADITGKITSKKTVGNDTLKLIIDDADFKGYENSRLFGHLDLCAQSSDGQPHVSLESQKYLHLEAVTATTFDIGGTGATGVEKVVINSSGLHVTSGNLDVYNNAEIAGNLVVGGGLTVNGSVNINFGGSNTPRIYMPANVDDGGNPSGWYAYRVVDGILYDY